MPDPKSPAAELAEEIAKLAPRSSVLELPNRQVEWALRELPRGDALVAHARVLDAIGGMHNSLCDGAPRIHVAVQGICRVMLGGSSGMRGGGERFTAIVVHVTADGEPVRTVILPVE